MPELDDAASKRLLDCLPAIFQGTDSSHGAEFLADFLEAFQRILLGRSPEPHSEIHHKEEATHREHAGAGETIVSLRERIANLPLLFDPASTSGDFLPWLAAWAALTFQPELTENRKRNLLAKIVHLYQIRGTKKYLEELLTICVEATRITVNDDEHPPLQIDVHSTVGRDTYLSGGPPHFFRVSIDATKTGEQRAEAQRRLATSIIEMAKPAHTEYEFEFIPHAAQSKATGAGI